MLRRAQQAGAGFDLSWEETLGLALMRNGDVAEAEALFRTLTARTRQADIAQLALNWIEAQRDEPVAGARVMLPLPKGRLPSFRTVIAFRDALYFDRDAALKRFAELEPLHAQEPVFHYIWATVLGTASKQSPGDATSACQRLARVRALDPASVSAPAACGAALARAGDIAGAEAQFSAAYGVNPAHPSVLLLHGAVLNDARHFAAAADKLRRAEQAAPGDPRAPALAVSLAGLGDAAGAAAAKQRAAELVQRHSRR